MWLLLLRRQTFLITYTVCYSLLQVVTLCRHVTLWLTSSLPLVTFGDTVTYPPYPRVSRIDWMPLIDKFVTHCFRGFVDFFALAFGTIFLLLLTPRPEVNAEIVRRESRVRIDFLELVLPEAVERHLPAFLQLLLLDGKGTFPWFDHILNHVLIPAERLLFFFVCFWPQKSQVFLDNLFLLAEMFDASLKGFDRLLGFRVKFLPAFQEQRHQFNLRSVRSFFFHLRKLFTRLQKE